MCSQCLLSPRQCILGSWCLVCLVKKLFTPRRSREVNILFNTVRIIKANTLRYFVVRVHLYAMLQLLSSMLLQGMSLAEATSAKRFHPDAVMNKLTIEQGFPEVPYLTIYYYLSMHNVCVFTTCTRWVLFVLV